MAKILKHLGFGKKPPMPPRVDYNLRSYMGLGRPIRCNSESNLLEAVAEERAINKMTHRSQDDTQLVLLPDYSDPADLKEQFRREMGARKKLATSSASKSASLTTDDEFYSTPYETQRLPKAFQPVFGDDDDDDFPVVPELTVDEMKLTMMYGIWNQLTFAPQLKSVRVPEVHITLEGSKIRPQNRDDYTLYAEPGVLERMNQVTCYRDSFRFDRDVNYNVTFHIPWAKYRSRIHVWNTTLDDFHVVNQTSRFVRVEVTLFYHTARGPNSTGFLWNAFANKHNFSSSTIDNYRLERDFLFRGHHYFMEAMRRIVEEDILVHRFVRDLYKDILDGVHFNL